MKSTKTLLDIISLGVEHFLKTNGEWVEDSGEPLLERDETSVMLNCYYDEATSRYIPLYEFEDNGHVTQFDSFVEAFDLFIKNKGGQR